MASKLEQAARDLAQAAIQDTAGGVLTQEITTELKSVVAATKSLEKTVEQSASTNSHLSKTYNSYKTTTKQLRNSPPAARARQRRSQ